MVDLNFFIAVALNTAVLFIWFFTTAFYDYCKLIGLNKFFIEYEKTPLSMTYPQYLFLNKEVITKNVFFRFFIKLISCVFCLGVWTSFGFCVYFNILPQLPVVYICTLILIGLLKKLYNLD